MSACRACGAPLPPGAGFCRACGEAVHGVTVASPTAPMTPRAARAPGAPMRVAIAAFVAMPLTVAAFLAWMMATTPGGASFAAFVAPAAMGLVAAILVVGLARRAPWARWAGLAVCAAWALFMGRLIVGGLAAFQTAFPGDRAALVASLALEAIQVGLCLFAAIDLVWPKPVTSSA